MGFIMNGLNAEKFDRNYPTTTLIKRISGYFRPHKRTIIGVAITLSLVALAQASLPIVVARSIDVFHANPTTQLLFGLVGFVLTLASLDWSFNFVRQTLTVRTIGEVVLTLRRDMSTAVMEQDLSFRDHYASGRTVSRVITDTQGFTTVITLIMELLSQVLMVIVISCWLLATNIQLALVALALAPLLIVAALSFRRVARRTSQRSQRMIATITASVQQAISGIAVAKSFRQEAAIYRDLQHINDLAYRVQMRRGIVFNIIFPVLDVITGVGTAIMLYFGGRMVLAGTVSPGQWYLFVQSLTLFYFPLTGIASFWSQFQQGLAASERVFALIDAEPKVIQRGQESIGRLKGQIKFSNVDFSYRADEIVLSNFSLTIPAGQKLAVVGHTGAGKSSLLRLIARFYEFQSGSLLIDNHDIRFLDLIQYRQQLGLVPQSPFLFAGTIADNIRYGRPDATEEEVKRAALATANGKWIGDLPQGLQTRVGERGAQLSFGQRQLVVLARVLLHNPAIFLFDEATASIDPFTEIQIQASLNKIIQSRTSIIIAHRLSTVKSADRIIVMESGHIVEDGNHIGLLARKGTYAQLYNTYFRHQSPEYIMQADSSTR